ncbi:hypothetical protein [Prosthecochloris sp.]|uniref:hypothetical protein n=1 Tax=Prosthecochloris sp. TaxID=290513 RepID=UPI0025F6BCCB|nr:hypothetical protein [Prosthecochloris sp.]
MFNITKMREFLKFFLVLLVLFAGSISIFLHILKSGLNDFIKETLNNPLEATVDYQETDISLFKAYSGVSITFRDLLVTTKSAESRDMLTTVDRLSVTFEALSIFSEELTVHSLRGERSRITIETDSAGNCNWDILP